MEAEISNSPEFNPINTPEALLEVASLENQFKLDAPNNIPLEEKLQENTSDQRSSIMNYLRRSKLGRAVAVAGAVVALAAGGSIAKDIVSPVKASGAVVCHTETTTSPEGATSTSTECTYEDEEESSENPSATNPGDSSKPDTDKPQHDDKPKHEAKSDKNKDKDTQGNLLPLPEKRTRAYWATKILNEIREGEKGRISASKRVEHSLYLTRKGKPSPVEQTGGRAKLDKTLLKVLYKASQVRRFYIWHFTDGPHVPTSHHFDGDAADLRKFNGEAPKNKSLFGVLRRFIPRNKGTELIGPGDDVNHTGPKNGHIHIAIF